MQDISNRVSRWPVSPVAMLVVLFSAAVVVAAGLAVVATASDRSASAKPEAATSAIDITVDATVVGAKLPDDAFGISLEVRALTQTEFGEGDLPQYLRTLGPGVLRLGGNSSDRIFWTSTSESPPEWASATLAPGDIDRLAELLEDTGWSAYLTVNLKQFDPERAADLVKYTSDKLGSRLRGVSIGHEPNTYYEKAEEYFGDFVQYVDRIRADVPGVAIIGPDAGSSAAGNDWVKDFVELEAKRKPRDIAAMSQHAYPQTACNNKTTDISSLLKGSTYTAEKKVASDLTDLSARLGVPAIISETNSVSCNGQQGVSDVYASALWGLSHGLAQSAEGVTGSYFHGSVAECGAEDSYNHYTPFCAPTKDDLRRGQLRPQPLYYGLLVLGRLGAGEFVSIKNSNWANVHAFGIKRDNQLDIVLINVTSPDTNGASRVTATVKGTYSGAKSYQLISKGRNLDDTKDITFAGNRIEGNGTFDEPAATSESFDGTKLDVLVPAGSAKVITLS